MSVALILPAASVGWIDDPYLAVVVLTIAAMGVTSTEAIYMACIQDVSFLSVGLISGVLGGVGNIVGAEVNPVIGRYVDTHGHYNMVFVVLAIAPVVSAVAIIVFGSIVIRWQRRAPSAA